MNSIAAAIKFHPSYNILLGIKSTGHVLLSVIHLSDLDIACYWLNLTVRIWNFLLGIPRLIQGIQWGRWLHPNKKGSRCAFTMFVEMVLLDEEPEKGKKKNGEFVDGSYPLDKRANKVQTSLSLGSRRQSKIRRLSQGFLPDWHFVYRWWCSYRGWYPSWFAQVSFSIWRYRIFIIGFDGCIKYCVLYLVNTSGINIFWFFV